MVPPTRLGDVCSTSYALHCTPHIHVTLDRPSTCPSTGGSSTRSISVLIAGSSLAVSPSLAVVLVVRPSPSVDDLAVRPSIGPSVRPPILRLDADCPPNFDRPSNLDGPPNPTVRRISTARRIRPSVESRPPVRRRRATLECWSRRRYPSCRPLPPTRSARRSSNSVDAPVRSRLLTSAPSRLAFFVASLPVGRTPSTAGRPKSMSPPDITLPSQRRLSRTGATAL